MGTSSSVEPPLLTFGRFYHACTKNPIIKDKKGKRKKVKNLNCNTLKSDFKYDF